VRECTPYEQLLFLDQRQSEGDSIRDQDYEVHIREVPYRGLLLNSGHALVCASRLEKGPMDGMFTVAMPRFYILEPNHARR
jgi:hypothetical protein